MSPVIVVQRWGYRLAFRLLQLLWLFTRPTKRGVKCVITDGNRLLLVRHTYGRRAWDLPGGAARRREPPLHTARREMEEELGLGDAPWQELGELRGRVDHRRDVVRIFGAQVADPPLRVNRAELEVVAWFERDRLPLELAAMVPPILEGAGPYAFTAAHDHAATG